MATYEIIVTDVTCYGNLYCVAGWDCRAAAMVRPEPSGANPAVESSRFWDGRFAGPGKLFSVGNVVQFDAAAPPANFPFPHATEDKILMAGTPTAILHQLQLPQVVQAVAGGVSPSLSAAFDGALVRAASEKAYVPSGHVGRSLGAVEVAPGRITLYEDTFNPAKPKLRALINERNARYDLSITADAARSRWKTGGLAALQADLQASGRVHLRLGLSRPFPAMPNQCYAQVNGLYFL